MLTAFPNCNRFTWIETEIIMNMMVKITKAKTHMLYAATFRY